MGAAFLSDMATVITNRRKTPTQLLVRSRTRSGAFTTLTLPGLGRGSNVITLDDEVLTDQVEQLRRQGDISLTPSVEIAGAAVKRA